MSVKEKNHTCKIKEDKLFKKEREQCNVKQKDF